MKALVIVDVQNDFLPGGPLAVPHGDEVIPVANAVAPTFDLVVATQDWHPPDHGSFAANHPGREPGEVVDLNGLEQLLWPVHCVQNTPGAAFPDALDVRRIDRVFKKGTDPAVDSYSGFFDNGRQHATGLHDYLNAHAVCDVYLLGLATDVCVKSTALDAADLGFNTFLIEDGCRAVELHPGDAAKAIDEMRRVGVAIVSSASLLTD
jgi:nicotinamidase/pyrazinamidase